MAKTKIDAGKMLPAKKDVVKTSSDQQASDSAAGQIHSNGTTGGAMHRTTLDIPHELHKAIKKHLADRGGSVREYILGLVRSDLNINT